MKRRKFFERFGLGALVLAITPKVLAEELPNTEVLLYDNTIRKNPLVGPVDEAILVYSAEGTIKYLNHGKEIVVPMSDAYNRLYTLKSEDFVVAIWPTYGPAPGYHLVLRQGDDFISMDLTTLDEDVVIMGNISVGNWVCDTETKHIIQNGGWEYTGKPDVYLGEDK